MYFLIGKVKFSEPLRKLEFGEMMLFLQRLPTEDWGNQEIELVLSEAFMVCLFLPD
jgi:TBC1 domain family member 2